MHRGARGRRGATRRTVLRNLAALAASGTLGGVAGVGAFRPGHAEAAAGIAVNDFLALSVLLTGVTSLDPDVGATYLRSLEGDRGANRALGDLIARAGIGSSSPATTLDALAERGVFQDPALRSVADTVTAYWFSGVYDTPSGARVATWIGALAWTASYTKAQGVCGGATGYWATKPPAR